MILCGIIIVAAIEQSLTSDVVDGPITSVKLFTSTSNPESNVADI